VIAYFMGVWPGEEAGHYCRNPFGTCYLRGVPRSPWGDVCDPLGDGQPLRAAWGDLDVVSYRDRETHPRAVQPEGIGRVVVRDGWTLLTCWDRSGDARRNSHASFAFSEALTPEQALAAARERFPGVWARIDAHLAELGIAFRLEEVTGG
jgi:hypothetical protein